MKHSPDDILEAAVGLLDSQGVGVSTVKVARAAGVPNGTLFHYFPTKQVLLDAVYLRLKVELAAAIGDVPSDGPARERARVAWDRWTTWAIRHPERHRVMRLLRGAGLITPSMLDDVNGLFAQVLGILVSARSEGLVVDMPLEYLAAVVEVQLDLAVDARLDPHRLAVAFDMAWAAITISPPTAATSTKEIS